MDQRKGVLDFKCKKIVCGSEKLSDVPNSQKLGISGNQDVEDTFLFQTPEKTKEPISTQSAEQELNILEKNKDILNFFNGLTCSLRLLSLGKKLPTFKNVSAQVQVLTKRKFSHKDLAQIIYLLPEAIEAEKILVHDQKTLCMKPDLKITLLFKVIEGHNEQSDFVALRQVFATRLTSFFSQHPETCDIPEATLPEPFNRESNADNRGSCNVTNKQSSDSINETRSTSSESEILLKPSLLHPSFKGYFSKKPVTAEETEKITLLTSPSLEKEESTAVEVRKSSPSSSKSVIVNNQDIKDQHLKDGLESSMGIINPPNSLSSACKSPIPTVPSSDSFMVETPAQLTPKRLMPTSDDKPKNIDSQSESCNKPAKRSLKFTHLGGDESALSSLVDISQITESETWISEDTESATKTSPSLVDLVPLIHRIFQSANCSSITREELVYKIIINNLDIVEKGEVEKQIELLEKLVPDWICRKSAPTGDILYNIKKLSDLNAVQERLISS